MLSELSVTVGDVVRIHNWFGVVLKTHFDTNSELSIIRVQTARNIFRGHSPEYIDVRMLPEAVQLATLADLEKEIRTHHQMINSALDRMLSVTRGI